jgi:hypothetical protein
MAMDPVNPKALKGKFKDREDKDIDNDGDSRLIGRVSTQAPFCGKQHLR